jgi:hypothetical protein
MHVLNLNIERWTMLEPEHVQNELDFNNYDLSTTCDILLETNLDSSKSETEYPWAYHLPKAAR